MEFSLRRYAMHGELLARPFHLRRLYASVGGRQAIVAFVFAGRGQVSFSGVSGYHYAVLRSADLRTWTFRSTIAMPSVGLCTTSDNGPLPGAGDHRAAWVR